MGSFDRNGVADGPVEEDSAAASAGPSTGRRKISAVKVAARGEDFRIVQVHGTLLVCARQNGSCCCGWEEKGRLPFDHRLYTDEWERRKIRNRLHLSFTGCLGPCAVGNNALLQIYGQSIWLGDLYDPALIAALFDYAEAMLDAGRVLPPTEALRDHVYERHLPFDGGYPPLVESTEAADGLARLDPVCLMDVDPATARHTVQYDGRTIAFCAPSCKREFLADPAAYAVT